MGAASPVSVGCSTEAPAAVAWIRDNQHMRKKQKTRLSFSGPESGRVVPTARLQSISVGKLAGGPALSGAVAFSMTTSCAPMPFSCRTAFAPPRSSSPSIPSAGNRIRTPRGYSHPGSVCTGAFRHRPEFPSEGLGFISGQNGQF